MKPRNLSQKFLFNRVGFSESTLVFISNKLGAPVLDRTARNWQSGLFSPKQAFYTITANRLDEFLDTKAEEIKRQYYDQVLILPYYENNEDYWLATGDTSTPVDVYRALLERICSVKKSTFVLGVTCNDHKAPIPHFNAVTNPSIVKLAKKATHLLPSVKKTSAKGVYRHVSFDPLFTPYCVRGKPLMVGFEWQFNVFHT